MPTRLLLKDKTLFPIQAFFNAISDESFVRVMDHLTREIGWSINDCHCRFPGDLEPGEESFEGLSFSIYEDSIVIAKSKLQSFIKLVCEEHIKRRPEDRELVEQLVSRFEDF